MNEVWFQQPLFGISITVIFYVAAQLLNRRFRSLNPLLITSGGIMGLLIVCDIPYEDYRVGGDMIAFFLGPATIALAVPFYKYVQKLKGQLATLITAVSAGSICGLLAVLGIANLLNSSKGIMLTLYGIIKHVNASFLCTAYFVVAITLVSLRSYH